MNQRIAVRAIIKNNDKMLLVRRSTGRESILGLYELPGGKLAYGEQPEDALRRYLHDDNGLHIERATLFDVVTYIDRDDRNIQYAVITYTVTLADGHYEPKLSGNYDHYIWQSLTDIQQNSLTDLTQLLLGIIHQDQITDKVTEISKSNDDKIATNVDAIIYADGGSRGNPGPSASGYIIMNNTQQVLAQGGQYLGITTNNQAEYHGVRLALEKAQELGLKRVDFRLDSMLVVNQMNGIYTIKNRELWPINERIRDLIKNFDKVTFRHVARELNQLADGEVNKALDAHAHFEGSV
ncbi:MAG: fructose-2,6-bisphosphatase, putative phosphoglycerate mutase [Candidatus Saccharibacteria bacterium]|nr:fructose-2,6-bisphosphatase, putative phosphoglycerate mutase [Candidatus Saccharibacteria bacterium]